AKRDGRLFFVLPWNGYTMIGTTDTDYDGDPGAAEASSEDVEYLRTEAGRAFPRAAFEPILFTWAGVRALVREEGVAESEVSRKHALYDHEKRDGITGVLSVVGGKITAYRAIAEEVTDAAVSKLRSSASECRTAELPLPGAAENGGATDLARIGGAGGALAAPVCPNEKVSGAELVYAVRHEWAMTLGDVLLRRTML